jgi:hypothetical protein
VTRRWGWGSLLVARRDSPNYINVLKHGSPSCKPFCSWTHHIRKFQRCPGPKCLHVLRRGDPCSDGGVSSPARHNEESLNNGLLGACQSSSGPALTAVIFDDVHKRLSEVYVNPDLVMFSLYNQQIGHNQSMIQAPDQFFNQLHQSEPRIMRIPPKIPY